jgi:hypothetical protein
MERKINLKELEKKAFRSTFQDGIWDIFLGVLLFNLGFGPGGLKLGLSIPVTAGIGICVAALAMTGFILAKKYITTPRLGQVNFSPARKRRVGKVTILLVLSVVAGALLFVFGGIIKILPGTLGAVPFPAVAFGVNCLVLFSLASFFLNINRFYAYGILYAFSLPAGFVLEKNAAFAGALFLPFVLSAAIMAGWGIILFVRFLKNHPLPEKGAL